MSGKRITETCPVFSSWVLYILTSFMVHCTLNASWNLLIMCFPTFWQYFDAKMKKNEATSHNTIAYITNYTPTKNTVFNTTTLFHHSTLQSCSRQLCQSWTMGTITVFRWISYMKIIRRRLSNGLVKPNIKLNHLIVVQYLILFQIPFKLIMSHPSGFFN